MLLDFTNTIIFAIPDCHRIVLHAWFASSPPMALLAWGQDYNAWYNSLVYVPMQIFPCISTFPHRIF